MPAYLKREDGEGLINHFCNEFKPHGCPKKPGPQLLSPPFAP